MSPEPGVDPIAERPLDRFPIVDIDIIVDDDQMLAGIIAEMAAPQRRGHLLGVTAVDLRICTRRISGHLPRHTPVTFGTPACSRYCQAIAENVAGVQVVPSLVRPGLAPVKQP